VTIHLHLVPRLRMRGAIPPLPNTSSCRGDLLSTGTVLSNATSPDSSVSKVTGYGLDDWGSYPRNGREVLHHRVQTCFRAKRSSYQMATENFFSEGRGLGNETPPTSLMAWCLGTGTSIPLLSYPITLLSCYPLFTFNFSCFTFSM
jgi:hypothetical protein